MRSIQAGLDQQLVTSPTETAIDFWIESTGGDAHAAYKLVLDLRSRCKQLRSIVIDYAKSAATLLVMGTDQIFMAPAAELGPLDIQLEHPDREGVVISGLEAAGSLEFLGRTAFGLVCMGGAGIVKYTELPRAIVLHETTQFVAQLLEPIVGKFDPHLIRRANKQLKVAERYAITMLQKRVLPPSHQLSPENAQKLLKRLVSEYPVHEFIISREEARELGLPVYYAESHPRWSSIKSLYDVPREEGSTLLTIIPDSEIEEIERTSATASGEEENENQEQPTTEQPREADRQQSGNGAGSVEATARAKTV
ncbi:MAG: SDH family Clp fold serine proteinase [Pyrinomonadaceae bacterium]